MKKLNDDLDAFRRRLDREMIANCAVDRRWAADAVEKVRGALGEFMAEGNLMLLNLSQHLDEVERNPAATDISKEVARGNLQRAEKLLCRYRTEVHKVLTEITLLLRNRHAVVAAAQIVSHVDEVPTEEIPIHPLFVVLPQPMPPKVEEVREERSRRFEARMAAKSRKKPTPTP